MNLLRLIHCNTIDTTTLLLLFGVIIQMEENLSHFPCSSQK